MSCCPPKGYTKLFSKRAARRDARRYRRGGLDDTALEMVDFLRDRGMTGASVLEIGGGVGVIQLELLKAGAGHATNLELSPEYEEQAQELARDNVDVIVTGGTAAAKALKDATRSIPIVMAIIGNPVENQVVASLARPGGNITGASFFSDEVTAKRCEVTWAALDRVAPFTPSVPVAVFG